LLSLGRELPVQDPLDRSQFLLEKADQLQVRTPVPPLGSLCIADATRVDRLQGLPAIANPFEAGRPGALEIYLLECERAVHQIGRDHLESLRSKKSTD